MISDVAPLAVLVNEVVVSLNFLVAVEIEDELTVLYLILYHFLNFQLIFNLFFESWVVRN